MNIERAFDLLEYQLDNYPKEDAICGKEEGVWKKYSTQNVIDISDQLGLGLLKLGIEPSDKVAIISKNRPEWSFADFAIQKIGAISVPIYPNITVKDYRYIFEHAEVKLIFVDTQELYDKVQEANKDLGIELIYSFDKIANCKHWKEVETLGKEGDKNRLKELQNAINPEELFTIIYTSGTTGVPKGVMLSHTNVVSNALAAFQRKPEELEVGKARCLSFLPLCHIFERTGVYYYTFAGISVYYAESMDTIADNLKEIKPHTFNTVPRLLEKIYDKIVTKGSSLTGAKKALFFWALDLGNRYDPAKDMGIFYNLQLSLANVLIFSKWREALGNEVLGIVSGAAALQTRLARVFWAARIKVTEGYGLTETSPGIAIGVPNEQEIRMGTIGPAMDGVEIKIAEDGEVLCKGKNVMLGYYKQPDLTSQVITEGWFHTGDIGELVDGKYLRITDRKKEMFKTSGGKYIAPQVMENKFKESLLIEQIAVIGNSRKFPSALIVPNFEALQDWCEANGIKNSSNQKAVHNPNVIRKYQEEVDKYNDGFAKWETIKKFTLLSETWDIETGELTPTLKLKRRVINEKYGQEIEKMYE